MFIHLIQLVLCRSVYMTIIGIWFICFRKFEVACSNSGDVTVAKKDKDNSIRKQAKCEHEIVLLVKKLVVVSPRPFFV